MNHSSMGAQMEDVTGPNIPLLRKAVEWAEAEAAKPPELCEWEQNWYILTGEQRKGLQYVYDDAERDQYRYRAMRKAPGCGTCYCIAGFVTALGNPEYAAGRAGWVDEAQVAADALGIDEAAASEAGGLFYDTNTIADVRRIAESLAGERL